MKLGTLGEMVNVYGLSDSVLPRTRWTKLQHSKWDSSRWFAPLVKLERLPHQSYDFYLGVHFDGGQETSGLYSSDDKQFWVLYVYEAPQKRFAWELHYDDGIRLHFLSDSKVTPSYGGSSLVRKAVRSPQFDYEIKE